MLINNYIATKNIVLLIVFFNLVAITPVNSHSKQLSAYTTQNTKENSPTNSPILIAPEKDLVITDPDNLTFIWTHSEVSTYKIQIATSDNFTNSIIDANLDNKFTFTPNPNPITNGTYFWRVQAHSETPSDANWSETWSFSVNTSCETPDKPNLVSPTNNSQTNNNKPLFKWQTARSATEYELQVAQNASFDNPVITKNINETEYAHNAGLEDASYSWRVRGHNINGNCNVPGDWSDVYTVTIDTSVPNAPKLNLPTNDSTTANLRPMFEWSASDDSEMIKYSIQVSDNPAFSDPVIDKSEISQVSYTHDEDLEDKKYYWRVQAEDAIGNQSNWSETWNFTINSNQVCFSLTLRHEGPGENPTAEPQKSNDCAEDGQYKQGEVITLTAHPEENWGILQWIGTDASNNNIHNRLTMPNADHTVTAVYGKHLIHLPAIATAYIISGSLTFNADRSKGMTIFEPKAKIDFARLKFPGNEPPAKMKVWAEGEKQPSAWQKFVLEIDAPITKTFGIQFINVQFLKSDGTQPSNILTGTVFYIPNGDFQDLQHWDKNELGLPVNLISNGGIRLGNLHSSQCNNNLPGTAGISIILNLEGATGYKFYIDATVHTFDKLPPGYEKEFDAFEVIFDTQTVISYGNQDKPANCNESRAVNTQDLAQFL